MLISEDIEFIMSVQSHLEAFETASVYEVNERSVPHRTPGRWLSDSSLLVKRSQIEPPRRPRRCKGDETMKGDFRWKDYSSNSQSSLSIPNKPTRRGSVFVKHEEKSESKTIQSICSDKWTDCEQPSMLQPSMPVRRASIVLLPDDTILPLSNHSSKSITVKSTRQNPVLLEPDERCGSHSPRTVSSDNSECFRWKDCEHQPSFRKPNMPVRRASIEPIPDDILASFSSSISSSSVRSSPNIRVAFSA